MIKYAYSDSIGLIDRLRWIFDGFPKLSKRLRKMKLVQSILVRVLMYTFLGVTFCEQVLLNIFMLLDISVIL